MLAGGWFVNRSEVALVALAIGCVVLAMAAGRFRRRPRRIVRTASVVLAPVFLAGWILAEVNMPGPSLGGSMAPWAALPSGFVNDEGSWGAGYGSYDPRDQPCRSAEDLAANGISTEATGYGERRTRPQRVRFPLVLEGHFSGPFGGANFLEPSRVPEGDSPDWYFVAVAHDCFLTYGPAPGAG